MRPYREAQTALAELPGVGPKVAACVCLFALDKHAAIPVDTHVWQLAVEHYTPGLEGKSLTPRVMNEAETVVHVHTIRIEPLAFTHLISSHLSVCSPLPTTVNTASFNKRLGGKRRLLCR